MRNKIFAFLPLVFCVCALQAHEKHRQIYTSCEKSYIGVNQIGVAEDGIYIYVNKDTLIKTSAVHSDVNGIYFEDYIEINDQWICPQCHAINVIESYYCKGYVCDYRR